ncbi:hypothetical protein [Belnapia rosea]|uniref:UrcA family protein n=1 Tax=Belnapia rosea TaxID=938405 RepID=A0A1G7BV58_9PROT|nr:hypothetical protein [Belnapia rosea]SDE30842.1 hypothetical protein SAMN04487779_102734 [Belnapia rosea]
MKRLTVTATLAAALLGNASLAVAQGQGSREPQNLAEALAVVDRQVPSLEELISRNGCREIQTPRDRDYCLLMAAVEQQEREDSTRRLKEAFRRLRDANYIEFQPTGGSRAR